MVIVGDFYFLILDIIMLSIRKVIENAANSHVNLLAKVCWYLYNERKFSEEMIVMPNIKPISDLRNYTEVLKQVDASSRVYLTRNGHGEYGILTMSEIDELDRYRAAYTLLSKLKKAEERADNEGWISADDLENIQ